MIDLQNDLSKFESINAEIYRKEMKKHDEKSKESFELYNRALDSIKTNKSEDIAILELKKAISLKANFVEAMSLLGISYYRLGEKIKAAKLFKQVLKFNENNILALRYLSDLGDEEIFGELGLVREQKLMDANNKPIEGEPENKGFMDWFLNKIKIDPKSKGETKKLIMGITFGIAVIGLLSSPFYFGARKSSKQIDKMIKKEEAKYKSINKKYQKLENDYISLKNENVKMLDDAEYYKNSFNLINAEEHYKKAEYEKAADILVILKNYNFKEEEQERFEKIYDKALENSLKAMLGNSIDLYYEEKYDESLKKLGKMITFKSDWTNVSDVYYYTALNYTKLKNKEKALEYYNKIVNEYPQSRHVRNAKYNIKSINGQ